MIEEKIVFLDTKGYGGTKSIGLMGCTGYILNKISRVKIPIPNGFIIPTAVCRKIAVDKGRIKKSLKLELRKAISALEDSKKKIANDHSQLLLSVRISEVCHSSISATSMIELHYPVIHNGANGSKNDNSKMDRCIKEFYVNFLKQYGTFCLKIPVEKINDIFKRYLKNDPGLECIPDSTLNSLLIDLTFFEKIEALIRRDFYSQLETVISQLITNYFDIKDKKEFAVIVQELPFFPGYDKGGSGIAFSRNPVTGEKDISGFFVPGANIKDIFSNFQYKPISLLKENKPDIYKLLYKIILQLESIFKSALGIAFIIRNERLYVWDCFNAKLQVSAKVNAVADMVKEGVINEKEGILSLKAEAFSKQLLSNTSSLSLSSIEYEYISEGTPVGPGVTRGRIILEESDFDKYAGDPLVLIKIYSNPNDIDIISGVSGIIIAKGTATSHAVLISKNLGKCCIISVENLMIDDVKQEIYFGEKRFFKGDWLILDGSSGKIYKGGKIKSDIQIADQKKKIISWTLNQKKIKVMANCDLSKMAAVALEYGAEGLGLVRTENMFVSTDCGDYLRTYLISPSNERKLKALNDIERILINEIVSLLNIMEGKPIQVRLLDFPLHELLPNTENEKNRFSNKINLNLKDLGKEICNLSEFNPMLGMRGCRLSIIYPELLEVQIRAIYRAFIQILEKKRKCELYILIPFVIAVEEIVAIVECINKIFNKGTNISDNERNQNQHKLGIGVMIEQPGAALIADQLAQMVDFIAFGTNDLTQLMLGLSRDDSTKIIQQYLRKKIFKSDPFLILNEEVKDIIDNAIRKARLANPNIKIGICGEHAGHPENFLFFASHSFDYISCSLNDLPLTHFAAAYAQIITTTKYSKRKQILNFSTARILCDQSMEKIRDAIHNKNNAAGIETAMNWAKMISWKYGLDTPKIWKFFKRDIVVKWFGKREHRKFYPLWGVSEVIEYMKSMPGKSFRISKFPHDIACHAESQALTLEDKESWPTIISRFDQSFPIEVFPTPPENNMCFRAYNSLEEFYVEAGIGQAMFVFEAEQGKHPIVIAHFNKESRDIDRYVLSEKYVNTSSKLEIDNIKAMLKKFIGKHGENIRIRCDCLRHSLGVDYLAIEGYFDPDGRENVCIVDLDLPLDAAFMGRRDIPGAKLL